MEYQNLNAEEREAITERLDLVTERIHELAAEPEVCEPFRDRKSTRLNSSHD